MEGIAFKAKHVFYGKVREYNVIALKNNYKQHGYVKRKVSEHPYADKRGYMMEHRLIVEEKLGRFLTPRKELIHHLNGNRSDNRIENLKLSNPKDHPKNHVGKRNDNGQFIASDPVFTQKKYRLYDKDRNLTQIYTLQELIAKTFRRGKFEYRGMFTGLKDKNGKEIFEGDVVLLDDSCGNEKVEVYYKKSAFRLKDKFTGDLLMFAYHNHIVEIIGTTHENPELLESLSNV